MLHVSKNWNRCQLNWEIWIACCQDSWSDRKLVWSWNFQLAWHVLSSQKPTLNLAKWNRYFRWKIFCSCPKQQKQSDSEHYRIAYEMKGKMYMSLDPVNADNFCIWHLKTTFHSSERGSDTLYFRGFFKLLWETLGYDILVAVVKITLLWNQTGCH